jgi:ABC-type antimicrobial peptide transport system permease subunit
MTLLPAMRAIAGEIAPDAPMQRVSMLQVIVGNSLRTDQASAWIVGTMASGALALVAVGLYGLVAYLVACRTREIAVRLALGARQREVQLQVMKGSLVAVFAGVVGGMLVSGAAAPALRGLLFGVGESDPGSFALAAALVVAIALASCALSARRALSIEPMTLLSSQ